MNELITGLPNVFAAATEGEGGGHHSVGYAIFFYSGIVFLTILGLIAIARSGMKQRVFKNPVTSAGEQLYLFIENLCVGVIGSHGRKYVPFILSIWLYIFTANVVGLIFPHTPTADLSLNLGLSILTIAFVQWEGIKANGPLGHLRHFAGPKLPIALIAVSGIIFGIEIISEVMKMLSLSLRLFANISGGHTVKEGLDQILPGVPFSGIILPIEFLAALIQALVWSLLTCVYLSLVTSHEHEEHHDERAHGPHGGEEITRKDTGLTPSDTGFATGHA